MADFAITLTLPPNTPARAPLSSQISIGAGELIGGSIVLPDGASGLVGVAVYYRDQIIAPQNGGWYIGNNEVIPLSLGIELQQSPYLISLRGYNVDDTYPHTVQLRVSARPK